MTKSEEPDFFELLKTSHLPTLEQARLNLESRKFLRLREHFEKETVVQGGMPDRTRSPLATASNDTDALEQHAQNMEAKRQSLKHAEPWREDQGNLTTTPPAAFQYGRQQATKERVDQLALGINRGATTESPMKVPELLFRTQQQDELIKDELDLQSRLSGHSLLRQPQQQQQQQARAVQQHMQAEAVMMRQQEQQLFAKHHRAQMMQQMEQEQYLRAQGVRQVELVHQRHNQMHLLRQMDFLQQQQQQQQQRTGF
jgi:hypothetical protein